MAIVTGLSASRYYVNNPIWVDFDADGDFDGFVTNHINLSISYNNQIEFLSKYYLLDDKVSFDLAEIIKGLLPEPNSANVYPPQSMYRNFDIRFNALTFNRTFFYGGNESDETNISIPNNAVLKESDKIPVWSTYPPLKYFLNDSGIPLSTFVVPSDEAERLPVKSCNPVYLIFLNSKGGYSTWLFDEWELTKKSTSTDIIERRNNDLDLGLETNLELQVTSRVDERYTNVLRALLQSPDVYIYNINNIVNNGSTKIYTKIYNAGGTMNWNSYDSVNEFTFKFDLRNKNNPTLIWSQ